ncbi:MAG: FGGY family carbohydrate kinase [Chloroflexota bacterium]
MTAPILIGLDLGTTNIKALAFHTNGTIIAASNVLTPTHYPQPGWAHYEADEIWTAAISCLRQLTKQLENPEHIVSIGVSSFGETGFPLDAQGQSVYPGIAWFDQRTHAQMHWLEQNIGPDDLFRTTGLPILSFYGLCKLLWLRDNEPDIFNHTAHWLSGADYLVYRLCGVLATDFSLASRTMAMNLYQRRWADSLLNDVGVSAKIFPALTPSGTALAPVLPEIAQVTGVPVQTVVTICGHDHVCGAFALGINRPEKMLDSMGTAEVLFLPAGAPLDDPAVGQQGYSQGMLAVQDEQFYFILGGLYTSGGSAEWLRELTGINESGEKISYEMLIAEASQVPPGSLGVHFLPYLRLANPPYADPKARGAFIGLTTDAKRSVLFRAILEGVSYEARLNLETLLTHLGTTQMPTLYATGGSTRNSLWMQIKASIHNQTIHIVDIAEAVTLGAALMGGLAAGVYANPSDALDAININQVAVKPNPKQTTLYETHYQQVYRHIHPTLQELHHTIYDLH